MATMGGDKDSDDSPKGLFTFLMLISLFWTLEVMRNVVHTTTAGQKSGHYRFR
jgi:hypothetical protein